MSRNYTYILLFKLEGNIGGSHVQAAPKSHRPSDVERRDAVDGEYESCEVIAIATNVFGIMQVILLQGSRTADCAMDAGKLLIRKKTDPGSTSMKVV